MRNDARNGASEARLFTIYDLEIMRATREICGAEAQRNL